MRLNKESYYKIDRFIRNEFICSSPNLEKWMDIVNIEMAVEKENRLRRERISIINDNINNLLPEWMQNQIKDNLLPAPGIFPIPLRKNIDLIAKEVSIRFGIDTSSIYHFNFNDSYLNPKWTKVLAIPLHSEVNNGSIRSIMNYINQNKFIDSIGFSND